MIFAAIDPGAVNAAIAVFDDTAPLFVDDIRTINGMIDSVAFAKALADMRNVFRHGIRTPFSG
jgi:hypothetical protein